MTRIWCLVFVYVACAGSAAASTTHLYRFEDSPGFTVDQAGTADLTPVTAWQVPLPSSGPGSAFPTWGGDNASAAAITSGGWLAADVAPITDTFTAELFAHFNTLPTYYGAQLIGDASSGQAGGWSWILHVRMDGWGGSSPGELTLALSNSSAYMEVAQSNVIMQTGKDYYVGCGFDLAGGQVTFYVQNLTDGEPLQVSTWAHSMTDLLSVGRLGLGRLADTALLSMDGMIDEVRISDSLLAEADLLVNLDSAPVPEPGTLLLVALGAVAAMRRRGEATKR